MLCFLQAARLEAVRMKQLYTYSCDGSSFPRQPWATYQSLMSPQVYVCCPQALDSLQSKADAWAGMRCLLQSANGRHMMQHPSLTCSPEITSWILELNASPGHIVRLVNYLLSIADQLLRLSLGLACLVAADEDTLGRCLGPSGSGAAAP